MSSWRIYDSLNHFQTCSFCIYVKKVTSYVTLLYEETDAKTAFLLKRLSHHLINGTCVCTWMCTFMRLSFFLLLNLFFDSSYIYWYLLHPGCPHPHLSLSHSSSPLSKFLSHIHGFLFSFCFVTLQFNQSHLFDHENIYYQPSNLIWLSTSPQRETEG